MIGFDPHSLDTIQYFHPELGENYVPYVVETSIGLDRMFLAILSHSYQEEYVNDESRLVLSIPPILSPVKAAILPLTKKDGLPEKAKEILGVINLNIRCQNSATFAKNFSDKVFGGILLNAQRELCSANHSAKLP